jgi:AraC family transcriptional regulator, regulatory protein of adaptative response / DNA-3-methyladenine glycosylase II
MPLDWQACSRARLSRDPRFDGKFFIGVAGSGVYCRSICPAPTAKEKNVTYFATAAAAAEAGFRPCLRCRPECSPGTPAWLGTSNTVSRALRLIDESGLEEGGVEALSERLGVGSRHLRRLFLKHLGATPTAVAHTRRLHFAKKLIDETRLPMTQIAVAAGFGCVRRFNAGISKVYHRTPTQIRRLAHQKQTQPENQYLFRLRFRPPYDWAGILNFFAARAIPGVEVVEAGCYRRTISLNGERGYFEVSLDQTNNALVARVEFGDPRSLFFITQRIRAMFDLNADWTEIVQSFRADPVLSSLVQSNPGLRVPGCWNGFELAVRAILGQQISVAAARRLAGQLVARYGTPIPAGYAGQTGLSRTFPTAERLAAVSSIDLGMPAARLTALKALSEAAVADPNLFRMAGSVEETVERLKGIRGVGEWTAQYIALRAVREMDAFPATDIGLLRGAAIATNTETITSKALLSHAESWRPWRAYAAQHLWAADPDLLQEKGQSI